jgi:prepilin-type N-terminal cleavage/methylation domain-containing protein
MAYSSPHRSAFTLIELLVVIAIIAILSVVVVLVLNPAEILRKSRDSNRLSDLSTLNTALNVYAEDTGGSMGLSSTTYVSVPDPTATSTAGTDCSGIGSPFTGGGSFHCAASSTFRKVNGTGWIPINFAKASFGSPLGSLPIDPINTTSSNEYYSYQTDGTTYKMTADPESQAYTAQAGTNPALFTSGNNLALGGGSWVLVPGNSQFGTNNFYVMKYDAACARNGVALTTPADGNGYQDNNSGASNCTPTNGLAPSSLPSAIPIVDIPQTSAASYCANIGAHLITNNEWQTVAWNAEQNASNWSGAAVGSGYMGRGNSDNSAAEPASPSDGATDYLTGYADFTHRRTLALSDGSVVWDMGGNIRQWTNDTITGTNEPHGVAAGFNWNEFTAITTYGTMTQQTAGPANSTWNSGQGIGQINSENGADGTTYGFLRGGGWSYGADAGVEMLELDDPPGWTSSAIGFRCAR